MGKDTFLRRLLVVSGPPFDRWYWRQQQPRDALQHLAGSLVGPGSPPRAKVAVLAPYLAGSYWFQETTRVLHFLLEAWGAGRADENVKAKRYILIAVIR